MFRAATQEEAATAYDMVVIEYRGLNAVTNFDLSRYIKWLRPTPIEPKTTDSSPKTHPIATPTQDFGIEFLNHQNPITNSVVVGQPQSVGGSSASSALGLLLQSSKFKEMLERSSAVDYPSTPTESDPPRFSFPEEIQTYFECQDSDSFVEGNDVIFCDLNTFASPMFQHELDA